MSHNPSPTNDRPDLQTKNPNPPASSDQTSKRAQSPSEISNLKSPSVVPAPKPAAPQDPSPGRPATHGLRRRKLFITPEDHQRFIHFRHDMIQEIDPQDHTEHFFAEQIIAKRWLLLHADEAETAAMRNAYNAQMAYAQKRMQANTPGDPQNEDDCYDMAIAATCTNDKVHLVLRYRTTHERALFKFEAALRQYRLMREAREIADQRMSFDIKHPTSHIHPQSPNPSPTEDLRPIQTNCRNSPERDHPSEISTLKSEISAPPNPPLVRESSLAPTLAGFPSRDHSPAPTPPRNPRPVNHLRPIQTNFRNSARPRQPACYMSKETVRYVTKGGSQCSAHRHSTFTLLRSSQPNPRHLRNLWLRCPSPHGRFAGFLQHGTAPLFYRERHAR